MSKSNYEQDIEINPDALDVAWLEQPRLMLQYSKLSAKMRRELDMAKQELDIAKAEADRKIRESPEDYGLAKVTEASVSNAILNEDGYKDAYETYLSAKYESDMASGAVNAFEHRKSALENLVRLYGQQYFAGPSIPRDINKEWEKRKQQEASNATVGKMTRRTT